MKKLLFFIAFSLTAQMSYCQDFHQLWSVTPFTQMERINNEWKMTVPINLQYNIIKSLSAANNLFVGAGAGAGIAFNQNGNVNIDIPIGAYFGGQPFAGFPSIAIGGGFNLQTMNALLMINLHFAATQLIPGIQKSTPKFTPIIQSNAYDRTNIGFKKDSN